MSRSHKRRRPSTRPTTTDTGLADSPEGSPWAGAARRFWPLAVFVVALLTGIVHLVTLSAAPWFEVRLGDAVTYDQWARQIAGGDWIGQEVFYQAPLYPYFLGVLYRLLGPDLIVVRLVQLLLGATSATLLALAGGRFFGPSTGVVAGLMLALYPPVVFSTALVQKSALDILFVCAALWLLADLMVADRSGPHDADGRLRTQVWRWPALGLVLGCLVLTRENAAVLMAAVLGWIALDHRFAHRRLRPAALLLAGAALVLVPVAARNTIVGGGPYLTTSQFGPNFYIGNRTGANGTYQSLVPRRGFAIYERQDAVALAEAAAGRTLSPSEVSAYFRNRALADIRAAPGAWLALMGRKAALLWNAVEIADSDDQYTAAEWSPLLRLGGAVWHLGVLGPLALIGILITWPQRERLWPLYVMILAYAASVVVFYVFARYRLPLMPLLILFAAAGLVRLPAFVRQTPARRLAGLGAAVGAFAVFCNWPLVDADAMRATMHYNLGVVRMNAQDPAGAAQEFTTAVALYPAFAEAHNNLGIVLGQLSRVGESGAAFDRALAIDPDFPQALNNSGELLMQRGQLSEARARFERAVDLDPDYIRAQTNLGRARASAGDLAGAESAYRRAVELAPDSPGAHNALAALLGRQGRLDEAARHSARALELDPANVEAESNLAIVAASAGRLDEAATRLTRALALAPDRPQIHYNLATVRARQGRVDEARAEFEATLRLDAAHDGARQGLAALAGRGSHQ